MATTTPAPSAPTFAVGDRIQWVTMFGDIRSGVVVGDGLVRDDFYPTHCGIHPDAYRIR